MLKIENVQIVGIEPAIRGMRNPMNSWDKSDSQVAMHHVDPLNEDFPLFVQVGDNDLKLMNRLAAGGPVHAKYRRMIAVYLDITAPLYWWKEFDTYKVGTVANSCSTMHKLTSKEFELDDFSHDHLLHTGEGDNPIDHIISWLNLYRRRYLEATDEGAKKGYWWQMIQLLPSSYNQRRTVMLNYEVLANIYVWRRDHKLDEWHTFCDWIESLPHSELIVIDYRRFHPTLTHEDICKAYGISDIGEFSDGYHTFNALYHQRAILFAALVNMNKDRAWKSFKHEDGEACFGGGWFIVGIDTPDGSYTYHYEDKYWDMFHCQELERGKHWDGHTEKDVTRLLGLEV